MQVLDFYKLKNEEQDFWKEKIKLANWGAADFLISLIDKNEFYKTLGEDSKLFLLTKETELICFCTYTNQDCIRDEKLFPWIGFVFTFPEFRGKRCAFDLFDYIFETEREKENPVEKIYIATDHEGLYEKYGFTFIEKRIDVWGDECKIYYKNVVCHPKIETERMILRMYKNQDYEKVFKWTGDPKVNKFMMYTLYEKASDVKKWFNILYQNEKEIELAFELKETGELIGGGGIGFDSQKNSWVIGYNLRPEFWGKGFTVEALSAMIEYAKEKYGVNKIEGTFAVDNIGSRRVMEKLGMTFDRDTEYTKFDNSATFKAQVFSKLIDR